MASSITDVTHWSAETLFLAIVQAGDSDAEEDESAPLLDFLKAKENRSMCRENLKHDGKWGRAPSLPAIQDAGVKEEDSALVACLRVGDGAFRLFKALLRVSPREILEEELVEGGDEASAEEGISLLFFIVSPLLHLHAGNPFRFAKALVNLQICRLQKVGISENDSRNKVMNGFAVTANNEWGGSPLHYACHWGTDPQVCRFLIENGVSVLLHDKLGFLAINWLQEWLLPRGPPVNWILEVANVLLLRMAEAQDEMENKGSARISDGALGVDRFVDARGRTPMFSVVSDMEAQEAPDMDKAVAYVEWLLSRGSDPDVQRRADLPLEEEALVLEEKCAREVLTKWTRTPKKSRNKKGTVKAARRRRHHPYEKLQAPGRHLLSIIEGRDDSKARSRPSDTPQEIGTHLRSSSGKATKEAAELLERDRGVRAAAAAAAADDDDDDDDDDDEGKLPPATDGGNRQQSVGSGSGVVIFEVLDSDDESGELCRPIISHDNAIMVIDPKPRCGESNGDDSFPRAVPHASESFHTPKRKRQRTANAPPALSSSFCSNGRGSGGGGEDGTGNSSFRSRASCRALMMSASSWAPETNEKRVAAELLKKKSQGVRCKGGKRARYKPPSYPRGSVFLAGTMPGRPVETAESSRSSSAKEAARCSSAFTVADGMAAGALPRARWSIVQQNYRHSISDPSVLCAVPFEAPSDWSYDLGKNPLAAHVCFATGEAQVMSANMKQLRDSMLESSSSPLPPPSLRSSLEVDPTAAGYSSSSSSSSSLPSSPSSQASASSSPAHEPDIRVTFPEKNISNDRAELILGPLLAEQSLWSDPGFFPGVYCRVAPVEEDDPRVALRGHNALVASEDIPENTIVAQYCGRVCLNSEIHWEEDLCRKIGRLGYKYDVVTSDAVLGRVRAETEQQTNGVSSSTPGFDAGKSGPESDRQHPQVDDWLTIDAFPNSLGEPPVGNATMFINDSRGLKGVSNNCFFVEVTRNGWPHVFVVTSDHIDAGNELLIDYGKLYWQTMDPFIALMGLKPKSGRLLPAQELHEKESDKKSELLINSNHKDPNDGR